MKLIMASVDKKKIESPLIDLLNVIEQMRAQAKDRIECYRELFEWEYIPEEIFERMIRNERLGLVKEIDGILDYYRGLN